MELLGCFEEEGEGFLLQIVAGDETWVHHYDPENKRKSMEYHHKGSLVPKKFKTKDSAGKVMWTVFWNSEDVVLSALLQKGATVNSENYSETKKFFKKCTMRKGADIDDIFLQQDNATPHVSAATTDAIAHLGLTVLPHPVYSLDLALAIPPVPQTEGRTKQLKHQF